MKRKFLGSLGAIALGATVGLATPALAMHGGFGGMHGGFSGMHAAPHFSGGFHSGVMGSHGAFAPAHRFVGGQFAFRHHVAFHHHHHFRRFAPFFAFGVGYAYDDGCWRYAWTRFGWRLVDACAY